MVKQEKDGNCEIILTLVLLILTNLEKRQTEVEY